MKITDIRIDVIERDVPSFAVNDVRGRIGGTVRQGVLRVATDLGIEGNAFVGLQGSDGRTLVDQIVGALKPHVVGRPVAERERLWHWLERAAGTGGPAHAAWAPVDVALWDAAGKAAGMPIHALLGTERYEIPLYATYPPRHSDAEGYAGEVEQLLASGLRAYKLHPGAMPIRETIRTIERVRQTAGDDIALMLDPNSGYDYARALAVGRALDANGYTWFEDPVPWSDFDAVAELSRRLDTPLNISDSPGFLLREAARYVRLGALRLVRGTTRKLGITGLKKLCSLLEGFGLNCEIGLAGNSLMNAANLHVMMSVPNCAYYEYWLPKEVHQWGVTDEIRITERGTIEAPHGLGLGTTLDEAWIAAHRVATVD
jgi:L-alanine-DL-glutamate epimerase-like enolase superfamily enzyme